MQTTQGSIRNVAPEQQAISIKVDCEQKRGHLNRLWASLGFDQISWTWTPTGRKILTALAATGEHAYIRSHYIFSSGNGWALPQWGSGNVYHEDENGRPYFDFTIADRVFDAIVAAGHHPLMELGFTPLALVPESARADFKFEQTPSNLGPYESGLWAYPPKDLNKWAALVRALAEHCVERYGDDEVRTWLWELWNEPNIGYWKGTHAEYCRLYDVTAHEVRSVVPDAIIGGPGTIGDEGLKYLEDFVDHCFRNGSPLDFVSFHTKGASFSPWRTYLPIGAPPPKLESPSSLKMLREIGSVLAIMRDRPGARDLPCVVDECDASVPAPMGVYDNPNFGYRNTHYFAVFQCKLMKKLIDLGRFYNVRVDQAMTGSFFFPGERCFEGTRSMLTYGDIEKPLLNAYRMLGMLGAEEISCESDGSWSIERLHDGDIGMPEEVDALGATDPDRVTILVWRHADDQYLSDGVPRSVDLEIKGLPKDWHAVRVTHWRVDADHSNSHTLWKGLGAPEFPSAEQIAAIQQRQGLEVLGPDQTMKVSDGVVRFEFTLPLPSASLFEIRSS